MDEALRIGGREIRNRLFIGTGKFPSKQAVRDALSSVSAEVVTVALRRVDRAAGEDDILQFIPDGCLVMPNTSGARTAEEAVRIARLARAAGCGDWVKIEVISDSRHLLPDNMETIRATGTLAKEGFTVLPYMSPDLMSARRLQEAGAAAIMPLGSPIGSGMGIKTAELVQIIIDEIPLPVIVDAGIGLPSHACQAMEMGCAAVLVNTAIATARDPVSAARAFSLAVQAGRAAFLCGLAGARDGASASSPLTGFLHNA